MVLSPVNDGTTKNEYGFVELYIDNLSLNDVTLNVDPRISVPSGIHVYGQDFAQTGMQQVWPMEHFRAPRKSARTISIDLKGDKIGPYTVHFSSFYWHGDNKDNYNPISLSHLFESRKLPKIPKKLPALMRIEEPKPKKPEE